MSFSSFGDVINSKGKRRKEIKIRDDSHDEEPIKTSVLDA